MPWHVRATPYLVHRTGRLQVHKNTYARENRTNLLVICRVCSIYARDDILNYYTWIPGMVYTPEYQYTTSCKTVCRQNSGIYSVRIYARQLKSPHRQQPKQYEIQIRL